MRSVCVASKLAANARDKQALLSIDEKTGDPIRKTTINYGIAVPVGCLWRDPEREGFVVTEAFEPLLIHTELSFGELRAQRHDYVIFELRVQYLRQCGNPAFAEKTIRSTEPVSTYGLPDFIAGYSGNG